MRENFAHSSTAGEKSRRPITETRTKAGKTGVNTEILKQMTPANDTGEEIQLDAEEIEEISAERAGQMRMQQAQELASREFPGLILDRNQRQDQARALADRVSNLSEQIEGLKRESRAVAAKRGINLEGSKTQGGYLTGLSADLETLRKNLAKTRQEAQRHLEFPTAEADIQDRLHSLREKATNTNNGLTRKGIEAKIAKLEKISGLLNEANAYQNAYQVDQVDQEETATKNRREVDAGRSRVKAHEAWKKQNEKPAPSVKEKPKLTPLITDEEVAEGQKQAKTREKTNLLRKFQGEMRDQKMILEDLAEELLKRGEVVDLPWQMAITRPTEKPKKGFFESLKTASKNLLDYARGRQMYESLITNYEEAVEKYLSAEDEIKKLESTS